VGFTVVTNQSNIDNYGNVGTIRISTTGNNKIFSQVTENTYSNDITTQQMCFCSQCHCLLLYFWFCCQNCHIHKYRSKERSYDFNASGDSLLITVTINQSNIDNYGNVGTIQISTTGNNKIFSEVTETVIFISGGKRFVSIWLYGFTLQEPIAVVGEA
jgi:hypothetical protein